MPSIPLMPRYFIGRFQDHLDIASGAHQGAPEYQFWTPHWSPDDPNKPAGAVIRSPTSVIFVMMRDLNGIPHPNWQALPHVLSQKTLKKHFKDSTHPDVLAAMAQEDVPITQQHTTYLLAEDLHAKQPNFLP